MKLPQRDLIQKLKHKNTKKTKNIFLRIKELKIFYAFCFNFKVCDFKLA